MAKGVFTTKVNPQYDDLPEIRYHFPRTYLRQVEETVGDWIVYYEPRRQDIRDSGHEGRQAYFATAQVREIVPDERTPDHFYALVSDYLDFTVPVPFRVDETYFEGKLQREDGRTNKGAFGRSVRVLKEHEYQMILQTGFSEAQEGVPEFRLDSEGVAEDPAPYGPPKSRQIVQRPFRDRTFTRLIQSAYHQTCAFTGLKLVNGGGTCEIEAAHIQPVAAQGPDSSRNGIALCRTAHWMFDRGIVSLMDEGEILVAKRLVPNQARRMLSPEGMAFLPDRRVLRPDAHFLQYHRENVYKGD